jgi:hypothetical protein
MIGGNFNFFNFLGISEGKIPAQMPRKLKKLKLPPIMM